MLDSVLSQMRSNALLIRSLAIMGTSDTLKEARKEVAALAFELPYPEMEALLVNAIEVLALKMAGECKDMEEFVQVLGTVGGIVDHVIEGEK